MVRQASRMPYTLTTCISNQRCQGLSCNQNRRAMPANVNGTCPVPQVASKARRKGCGTSYPCQHHYPRDHVYQITQNIENKSTSQLLNTTTYSTKPPSQRASFPSSVSQGTFPYLRQYSSYFGFQSYSLALAAQKCLLHSRSFRPSVLLD